MPAQDIYHDAVVRALTADGWMMTHDPLSLSYGGRDLYVDLGAERTTIAAECDGQKIAVEIKSFLESSPVRDLEEAVGQYQIYRTVLTEKPRVGCSISQYHSACTRAYWQNGLDN